MRKFALTVMAVLAITCNAWAAPVITVVQDQDPVLGLRSFTVKATGTGINVLSWFTIDGLVNQTSTNSAWVGDSTAGGPTDSYVVFGDLRLPDLPGHWDPPGSETPPSKYTTETIVSGSLGTLNNYADLGGGNYSWDGYLKTGSGFMGTELTVDLLHLVMPQSNTTADELWIDLCLWTGSGPDYMTVTEHVYNNINIYAPVDGDTDKDRDVDLTDLANFAAGYFNQSLASWAKGDFDGDSDVDLSDFAGFASGYFGPRGGGYAGEAAPPVVPEPSTIVMLVLGALCLAGYRLRK